MVWSHPLEQLFLRNSRFRDFSSCGDSSYGVSFICLIQRFLYINMGTDGTTTILESVATLCKLARGDERILRKYTASWLQLTEIIDFR